MAKRSSGGTTVELGNGDAASVAFGSDTFTEIGSVTGLVIGGRSISMIEFQDLKSTEKSYEPAQGSELADSTLDLEEVDGPGSAELEAAYEAYQRRHLKFTFRDGTVVWQVVHVSDLGSINASVNEKMTRNITFKPVSKRTVVPA